MGRGVVLVALALAASLSLPAFAAGDVIRDEFFSCAAYEEQGDEPGLLIAACNPRMLARAHALGDDFPEVKFEGTSGGVQDKVPLLVTGIDPLSDQIRLNTVGACLPKRQIVWCRSDRISTSDDFHGRNTPRLHVSDDRIQRCRIQNGVAVVVEENVDNRRHRAISFDRAACTGTLE